VSTEGAKTVMVGNPTRNSGYFHGAFHQNRDFWWCRKVSSFDSPLVSENYLKEIAANYGADSNIYRVRVLGEFPQSEDDVVIPLHLIEAARERDVVVSEAFYPVWGLDVARFGDDRTALCKRFSNALLEPIKSWHVADTM
jgi:phage terminase large subunit